MCKAVPTCSSNMNEKENKMVREEPSEGFPVLFAVLYADYLRKVQPAEAYLEIREMSGISRVSWCCRGAQMGHLPSRELREQTLPIYLGCAPENMNYFQEERNYILILFLSHRFAQGYEEE